MSKVPNSDEGGLSDQKHIDEARYYAEEKVEGVNVETGRGRSNPDTGRYNGKGEQRRSKGE